ncbi:MAG: hypothetical protein EOO08_12960 [Chitinophagaceae bacterium]|nr:MAG: hypothetical protein EOO08_12960 [Chitinophagaceae bacterium]
MKKTRIMVIAALLAASGATAQELPAAPAPPPPPTERKIRNFDDVQAELDRVQKQLDELQRSGIPEPPPPPAASFSEARRALARADRDMRALEGERGQMQHARREMERARRQLLRVEADLPRIQAEARRAGMNARWSVKQARVNVAKAGEESKEYKAFEDELVTAGLIERDSYQLEHRDGKFYINGKEQPGAIYQKYRTFLDKHKKFRWTRNSEQLNISGGSYD